MKVLFLRQRREKRRRRGDVDGAQILWIHGVYESGGKDYEMNRCLSVLHVTAAAKTEARGLDLRNLDVAWRGLKA